MPKPKSTKQWDDVLRGVRDPERYDPKARSFGGPWRMVKCKDGAYVCYELYLEVMENLRKNAEINPAQSPHDSIHTCSRGCKKPGCNRALRDTIEEQNAQIEALKQDLKEEAARSRHVRMKTIHFINTIGGQQEELAALRSQFANSEQENARLKAENQGRQTENSVLAIENDRLKSEVDRLEPELEQRCRELNLSLAQQAIQLRQIGELKAEVERLRKVGDALVDEGETMAHDVSWVPYVWDNRVAEWNAAKEGKPSV